MSGNGGQRINQLSRTHGIAPIAADVVFAVAQLQRGRSIDDDERQSLVRARDLLTGVAEFGTVGSTRNLLLSGEGTLDAFETVQRRAPRDDRDPDDWARELAQLIDRALAGKLESNDEERLTELRGLFASLTKLAVARANSAVARRDNPLRWTGSQATSLSS